MSPSQASSDDFPRLIGADNFDVWKARDSGSDMSDTDDPPKITPAKTAEIDSDVVDYGESDDDLKPASGSDEDSNDGSDTVVKSKDLPVIRPFNHREARQVSKQSKKVKLKPLSQRERRRQEAKTKAFLMKTMDNTHVRLVKNLVTSYDIFTFICEKYEGAAFHGDPYFIQHYLMEIKYEEGSDLTEFFFKLENAIKAASEATESVMREDLKQSIDGKVRDIQAQERYTLLKGTPESNATKNERALMASGPPTPRTEYDNNVCSTVLPANFALKGNSKRDHPYRNTKNRNRGRNGGNNNYKKDKHNNVGGSGSNDNPDKSRGYEQRKKRESNSDGDDSDSDDNRRKVYRQKRHETGLIAIATTINPPLSLKSQANVKLDTTWTIDSGCTRHVTHEAQWFSDISASGGSITVGGKNQIPIEGVGRVELDVIDSKGNSKTLTLHGVLTHRSCNSASYRFRLQ
ncbi:hypothetical protein PHPALM_31363 [Phytophthora palmivora]|uniref:Retrovirus-related Pol polyprotein from transposon TNT 1-94-like beta-barrel domain-containing protein n=1 Tax=Phytophthora palmivora TaxID=4796 RepID=A0A2P4X2T0_9STRA|nr:hypothetical protein PHPALM_31363 [Phytophthora palmivora]